MRDSTSVSAVRLNGESGTLRSRPLVVLGEVPVNNRPRPSPLRTPIGRPQSPLPRYALRIIATKIIQVPNIFKLQPLTRG